MRSNNTSYTSLVYHPLTIERWPDFEDLFGEKGAYSGCWCMWWRLKRSEFEKQQGEGNRKAIKAIVQSGEVPGILAYMDTQPIAWCSVAPRESYPALNRSPVLKKLDDTPVWSIVCFFVAKGHRKRGIIQELITAAVEYVQDQNGKIIEAYPTVPKSEYLPPVSVYMGLPSMFRKAGFVERARPSKSKIIMRYYIDKST